MQITASKRFQLQEQDDAKWAGAGAHAESSGQQRARCEAGSKRGLDGLGGKSADFLPTPEKTTENRFWREDSSAGSGMGLPVFSKKNFLRACQIWRARQSRQELPTRSSI